MATHSAKGASASAVGGGTWDRIVSSSGRIEAPSGASPPGGSSRAAQPCLAEAYSTGKSSCSSVAPSDAKRSNSWEWTSPQRCAVAEGRSALFRTTMGVSPRASALPSTNLVWLSGPSDASTSSTAPSTIPSTRSTSPPKSACPGVSTAFTVWPP